MRLLRLAVILPVLFCGVEGLLWFWDLHSVKSIPTTTMFWDTPADVIGWGLDFPAYLLGGPISGLLDGLVPDLVLRLNGFLWVAGLWYLIGKWFDRRAEVNANSKPEPLLSFLVFPTIVLVFGVFVLVFSFARVQVEHISNFIQTIQIALLQTWAVFLIGIPAVAIVRYFLEIRWKKHPSGSASRHRTRISNFRLFELIVAAFVVLLLLWYPHGPLFPK